MARELPAGANGPLPAVAEIHVAIGWEPEKPGGQDADPSAFLLGSNGQVGSDNDFVFYNNPRAAGGAVELLPGTGPDRQRLAIRLGQLPASVDKIAVCLTLFGGGSWSQASRLHVRVLDGDGGEHLLFTPDLRPMVEAALILGEVYRRNDQWKFRAVGQGFAGGLAPLAQHFGVTVDEDPADQAAPPAPPPPSRTAPAPPSSPSPTPTPVGGVMSLAKAPATGALPTGSRTEHSRVANLSYEILYKGAYALARVDLPAGRQLRAQADAMVAMQPTVEVTGKMEGGLLGGLGRMVSGESLFLQTLAAKHSAGAVYFAPSSPGDIAVVELNGEALTIQKDGFLACSEGVQVNTKMQNLAQGLFSGEGFFVLQAQGQGLIFLESYGAIHELNLGPGEQKIIDNGHLVAWSQSMNYQLEAANIGILASFTSGENIVCRFHGPGKILIQTREPHQFGLWLSRFLPGKK